MGNSHQWGSMSRRKTPSTGCLVIPAGLLLSLSGLITMMMHHVL